MKRLGVIANLSKAEAPEVVARLHQRSAELGLDLLTCDTTRQLLPETQHVEPGQLAEHIDALVSLGGDGTMLYSARLLDGAHVPIMGVNLGTLGFMTSVRVEQLETALDALVNRTYIINERSVLQGTSVDAQGTTQHFRSLNEVVLGWGASSKVACINLLIDDEWINAYICDGMMVSTPTGSTGHGLSAGGPIVHPQAKGFIINFVCPHSLSARPIVVPNTSNISLVVDENSKDLVLSVDGQSTVTLGPGGRVDLHKADHGVGFIGLPGSSYYQVLKDKLTWSHRAT